MNPRPGIRLPYHAAVADLNQRQMMGGTMTSAPFRLARKYLVFAMSGAFNPDLCYVDVLVQGETVSRVGIDVFAGGRRRFVQAEEREVGRVQQVA